MSQLFPKTYSGTLTEDLLPQTLTEKAQSEKDVRNKRIQKSIKEAEKRWQEAMGVLKNPKIPKTEQMTIDLAQTCAGLEARIKEWKAELTPKAEEDENQALYKIHT